jgi:hypothetical protein
MATPTQFVPLDSELFISSSTVQPLVNDFRDGRSIVAKRYRDGLQLSKPDILRCMIRNALRADINATYFLSDAWFATKPTIKNPRSKEVVAKTFFSASDLAG